MLVALACVARGPDEAVTRSLVDALQAALSRLQRMATAAVGALLI